MPRPRKIKRTAKSATRLRAARSGCTALLVIDETPLRQKAVKDCRSVIRQRDKARGELQRYEQEDSPAFSQWYHREFGADLTRLRELDHEIGELAEMVREVEYISVFSRDPEWRIYASFKERREAVERGDHASGEDDEFSEGEEDEDRDDDDWEDEGDFDDDWEEEFEEEEERFWEEFQRFFGGGRPGGGEEAFGRGARGGQKDPNGTAARVKEIYRTLVRRLHPDMIPETDAVRMDLWNAVQDAYRDRDLERLEMLLSTCEMEEGVVSENTPVSRLRETWRHIKDAVNALRQQTRKAKKTPAWLFSSKTPAEIRAIHRNIQRDIRRDLDDRDQYLQNFKNRIAHWERQMAEAATVQRPAPQRPARARPRRRPPPPEPDPRQTEFSF